MKATFIAPALAAGLLILFLASPSSARTWYVNASGTGDAPTISAALDSASGGDSVLVGPGSYGSPTLTISNSMVLASELGPLNTTIHGTGSPGIPLPPYVAIVQNGATIEGFRLLGAYNSTVYALQAGKVRHNIIESAGWNLYASGACEVTNNLFLEGNGLVFSSGAYGSYFTNNIVLCRIDCERSSLAAACNDFLGPDSACLQSIMSDYPGLNFSADPQFCGIEGSGNYYLQSDSPCAAGNTPGDFPCALIGPLPVGCSAVDVQTKSWGEIKAMYRD